MRNKIKAVIFALADVCIFAFAWLLSITLCTFDFSAFYRKQIRRQILLRYGYYERSQ